MRLVLGAAMALHGYQKVVPAGALHHHAHYVVTLGLPYWLGYVSAFTELIGGVLLIIGLFTRLAAAFVAINMLTAFVTVGIHQGFGSYNYILALAALSYLGLGLPDTTPTWGGMLANGTNAIFDGYWWQIYPAGIAIVLTVVAFNFIGDALRDSLDVRLQHR